MMKLAAYFNLYFLSLVSLNIFSCTFFHFFDQLLIVCLYSLLPLLKGPFSMLICKYSIYTKTSTLFLCVAIIFSSLFLCLVSFFFAGLTLSHSLSGDSFALLTDFKIGKPFYKVIFYYICMKFGYL